MLQEYLRGGDQTSFMYPRWGGYWFSELMNDSADYSISWTSVHVEGFIGKGTATPCYVFQPLDRNQKQKQKPSWVYLAYR